MQEVFLGQLYELHRAVQLQRHLVSVCDKPAAVAAELAKLEAEQSLRHHDSSDVTVEQVRPSTHLTLSAHEADYLPK